MEFLTQLPENKDFFEFSFSLEPDQNCYLVSLIAVNHRFHLQIQNDEASLAHFENIMIWLNLHQSVDDIHFGFYSPNANCEIELKMLERIQNFISVRERKL